MLHELTKQIVDTEAWEQDKMIDAIVRKYLSEKVGPLREGKPNPMQEFKSILGLSEVRESKVGNCKCEDGATCIAHSEEQRRLKEPAMGNCDLCSGDKWNEAWAFCPRCGKRVMPVEKSLEEKFRDWFISRDDNQNFCTAAAEALAKIAEQHFNPSHSQEGAGR